MPNVNLMGPTDWTAQQEDILRRRRMAELMQQQAVEPIQNPNSQGPLGSVPTPISWTQGLAKMLQAYTGARQQADLSGAQRELGQRYTSEGQKALIEGLKTYRGTPGTPDITGGQPGTPDEIYQPGQPATQASPDQAIGILGGHPMTQPLAQAILTQQMKAQEPYSLAAGAKRYGPGGAVIADNPKPVLPKEHVVGGNVYRSGQNGLENLGGPGIPVDYNKPFLPTGEANQPYQDYAQKTARSGASQMSMKVNSFLPASEEAQRDFIKSTRATYDQLKQAPVAIESIEKAKALIPQAKGFMGPGGEPLLYAAKFLNNRIGTNINTEGVKSAEELRTRIFFNIMDNLKKMDAQPSQQQQQIMQESLGKLGTDPNALPNVLDAFGQVMKDKVSLHNTEVQSAIQRGVKFPYDPIVKMPQNTADASKGWTPDKETRYQELLRKQNAPAQ